MPEEINRILTDRVSSILFCPTETAIDNLKNEGYENFDCKILKSGDVMQDGALFYKSLAKKPEYSMDDNYILSTIHRAENTDDLERLGSIIEALNELNREKQVILPIHPRTKKIIESNKIKVECTTIEPVGYLEMVWLIDNCDMVMTDSGGLQKEAFFFEKPCITLRDETEWIELVENRFNVLAGANKDKILDLYKNFKFSNDFNLDLYGSGIASQSIVQELLKR
jgi:UDP-GlcNAc3NAcA epimerase